MADPFEVRMRFTGLLQNLNASAASAQKVAHFALKNKDMREDLHSCIVEQLEQNPNLNIRANIMYFIEHFLDVAGKEGQADYIAMMQRDIGRIVEAVAPHDGPGATNIAVAIKVIRSLGAKHFLSGVVADEIEGELKKRETSANDLGLLSPTHGTADFGQGVTAMTSSRGHGQRGPLGSMNKRQIEQRIEEDRERHKRQRENIWAVTETQEIDQLFRQSQKATDEPSFADDIMRLLTEENEERYKCTATSCDKHESAVNGRSHI